MQKNKKPIIILLLTLCIFLLTGWGKKAAELLNDSLLIDLNQAIKESSIGNQGNTLAVEDKETESDDIMKDNQTVNIPPDESMILQEEKKAPYIITIRDMTITYDNNVCNGIDVLKTKIIGDCSNGAGSVYLVDDYAESHVYNEVLTILAQLHETIGLEYGAD